MAHYAKIGLNSKVIAVHVVPDSACLNASGVEDEEVGRQYLENIHNWPLWKKTSFNTDKGQHSKGGTPLRGNYAGIGMIYDEDNDIFIGEKPYPSWTLNTSTATWDPPVEKPSLTAEQQAQKDAGTHFYEINWNESTQSWDVVNTAV